MWNKLVVVEALINRNPNLFSLAVSIGGVQFCLKLLKHFLADRGIFLAYVE